MNESEKILNDEFFVIDSINLEDISSRLYGYCIIDGKIVKNNDNLHDLGFDGLGAYVFVDVKKEKIIINQDFLGCYGLYIYQQNEYFAISNSFLKLVDYLKESHVLSLNKVYADSFLPALLCSTAYDQTLINEISVLPRNFKIIIDKKNNSLDFDLIDYKEHSVNINSKEGLDILDNWFFKWVKLIRSLKEKTNNISFDLSGGFDSRIVAVLWLSANIDLDKVKIRSLDNNERFDEDFEIASAIAKEFNFKLNSNILSNYENQYFDSLKTVLNNSFYVKLGFHKEMYFSNIKSLNTQYSFSGGGGEAIRTYFDMTPEEFLLKFSNRSSKYSYSLVDSTESLLLQDFDKIKDLYSIEDNASKDIVDLLFKESRCRNHFGKAAIERYLANVIRLSPLLDSDLHKLKLTTEQCDDKYLLMAVILNRYCPKLLNFKFNGGRSFNDDTVEYAKSINKKYPFKSQNLKFISEPDNEVIYHRKKSSASPNNPNKFLENVFNSKSFEFEFCKYYSSDIYDYIKNKLKSTTYFPLSDVFAAVSILKCIGDVEYSKYKNFDDPVDWLNNFLINPNDKPFKLDASVQNLLRKYNTARIDIKNFSNEYSNLEVIDVSDNSAQILYPNWFKDLNGQGVVINSEKNNISMKVRCNCDGKLVLKLKGMDYKNNLGRRIPIYINYTKFLLDNSVIFDETVTVWHDSPYIYQKFVKNGDILDLYIEWTPF